MLRPDWVISSVFDILAMLVGAMYVVPESLNDGFERPEKLS
jgi:hypothetical protein